MPRSENIQNTQADEGVDLSATASASPLDAEPVQRVKSKVKGKQQTRKVVERTFEEAVPTPEADGAKDESVEASEFVPNSPLDSLSEASQLTVEVFRDGPGEGPGWFGRMYDFGDGRGPQPVSYGRVGTFNDDRGVIEKVQATSGGGETRFIRRGKKPVVITLGGPPLPLPSDQGYPNGAVPSGRGFDRGFDIDPQDPYAPDEAGFVQPREFVQEATGRTGWVWVHSVGAWDWLGPGPRPKVPPPLPGASAAAAVSPYQGFPQALFHDEQTPQSRLDWVREQEQQRRDEERTRREEEREQRRADEERRREEARERREEEQKRRDDEREERRREEDKRREEARERDRKDEERRKEEREQRRADEERAREDRKAAAELARVAAEKQAEAIREAARLTADSAKESARIQAENNKLIFDVLLKKSGDGGTKEVVDLGLRIAQVAQGAGTPEKTTAQEVASAIKECAKPVSESVRDSILAVKGFPVPGQPAPQQITGPPAAGQQPQQQSPAAGSEAAQTAANLHLVQYFVSSWESNIPPSVPVIRQGVIAYGLKPAFIEVLGNIAHPMATPEVIVGRYKQGCQVLGNPPMLVGGIAAVEKMAADPKGRAWFVGLQQKARAFLQEQQPQQGQQPPQAPRPPAPQPAAPQPQQPPAAAPPKEHDPRDPYACDPTRPPILPS